MRQSFCRLSMNDPPTSRLCEKFVVRPSGGSLYLGFRLITNFRLKAELRTSCFYTVSQLVDRSYSAYKEGRAELPSCFLVRAPLAREGRANEETPEPRITKLL